MSLNLKQFGRALWSGTLSLLLYFSGVFVFWTPLPLLYLSLKGKKTQWFAGLFSVVILATLFYLYVFPDFGKEAPLVPSHFQALGSGTLAYYMMIAFLLSFGIWKRWNLIQLAATASLTVTAAVLTTLFLFQKFGVYDVWGFFHQILQDAGQMLDQIAQDTSRSHHAEELQFIMQAKLGLGFLPKLIPAILFTFTVFVVTINIGILRLFYRVSKPLKWAGDFRRLQLPAVCVWALIFAGFGYFLDHYLLKMGWPKVVAVNLFISVAFVYFLQGLSIMAFFLKNYSLLFRFGIYGLVLFFFQMMSLMVVGVGLADTWFDFRKLQKQKEA